MTNHLYIYQWFDRYIFRRYSLHPLHLTSATATLPLHSDRYTVNICHTNINNFQYDLNISSSCFAILPKKNYFWFKKSIFSYCRAQNLSQQCVINSTNLHLDLNIHIISLLAALGKKMFKLYSNFCSNKQK